MATEAVGDNHPTWASVKKPKVILDIMSPICHTLNIAMAPDAGGDNHHTCA